MGAEPFSEPVLSGGDIPVKQCVRGRREAKEAQTILKRLIGELKGGGHFG